MNKQRLIILIIAIIGMLAVFMPWMNMPMIGGVNGARGYGWFVLLVYAIPAALSLLNDRSQPLKGISLYGAIIPGLACSAIALWKIMEFNSSMSLAGEDNLLAEALSSGISIGFGLYLVILAGIAIATSAFLFKEKSKEEE